MDHMVQLEPIIKKSQISECIWSKLYFMTAWLQNVFCLFGILYLYKLVSFQEKPDLRITGEILNELILLILVSHFQMQMWVY